MAVLQVQQPPNTNACQAACDLIDQERDVCLWFDDLETILAALHGQDIDAEKPVAYMTEHDHGDMLWLDHAEALKYCNDDAEPIALCRCSVSAENVLIAPTIESVEFYEMMRAYARSSSAKAYQAVIAHIDARLAGPKIVPVGWGIFVNGDLIDGNEDKDILEKNMDLYQHEGIAVYVKQLFA